MSNNKEKEKQQLGMSLGKAAHRLRKIVFFSLVKKLSLDVCFRCNEKIERVEDLSLDHKVPWLDVDVALFWDEGNIAFSHLSCNSSAGGKGNQIYPSKQDRWRAGHEKRDKDPVASKAHRGWRRRRNERWGTIPTRQRTQP